MNTEGYNSKLYNNGNDQDDITPIDKLFIEKCMDGNITELESLIQQGANDFDGGLLIASEMPNIKLAKFMLEKGAKNIDACLDNCRDNIRARTGRGQNMYIQFMTFILNYGKPDLNKGYVDACVKADIKTMESLIVSNSNYTFDHIEGFNQVCKVIYSLKDRKAIAKYKKVMKFLINEGVIFCDSCELVGASVHLMAF